MTNGKRILTEKKMKKWLVIIVAFVATQVLFTFTDGTFLEPKLNNLGYFAKSLASHLLVLEWITIYDNLSYKLITVLAIIQIAYLAIKDLVSINRNGKNVSQ